MLIRLEENGRIYLNLEHPLTIGLVHNKQLRTNLQEVIRCFNAVISKTALEKNDDLVIEFKNSADSVELKKTLNEFRKRQFVYKIFALPKVKDINKSMEIFLDKFIAIYFRFDLNGRNLHLYGPQKALDKVLVKIKSFTDNLVKTEGVWKVCFM